MASVQIFVNFYIFNIDTICISIIYNVVDLKHDSVNCSGLLLCKRLFYLVLIPAMTAYDVGNASALETYLLTNYHNSVRPLEVTSVDLGAGPIHINSLL